MGRIVPYSGAHGTGKSTACGQLYVEIKKRFPVEVGFIIENARMCPFPVLDAHGNKPGRAAQTWIFTSQMRKELEMAARYRITVSDRSVVDAIAYTSACGYHDLAHAMMGMARTHCAGLYEAVIFRGIADNPYLKADGFRATDPGFQKNVEDAMLAAYDELGVEIIRDRAVNDLLAGDVMWRKLRWVGVD